MAKQHHRRLAILTSIGLVVAAVAAASAVLLPPGETLLHLATASDVDGEWRFAESPGRYTIVIRDGEIVGGFDGCNAWGFAEERAADGSRMVVSDAQGCEPQPFDETYRLFAFGTPGFTVQDENLLATVGGKRERLVRVAER